MPWPYSSVEVDCRVCIHQLLSQSILTDACSTLDGHLLPRAAAPHTSLTTTQYIQPQDAVKLAQAELVVIDEAAAIPLPLVKALLGPYLVFMASTINGCAV
jgi:tRNA(Met) C34 N-acetyltransferase TmcA